MVVHILKPKTCKHCGVEFTPARPMQAVCRPLCAMRYVRKQKSDAKIEIKTRKDSLKPVGKLEEECRQIVQKIARLRDRNDECISCDKPATWNGQWHGSHFRAHGGCSSLQFNLLNIHKSCWICNKLYSGNTAAYEEKLRKKLGDERVDWLKEQPKSKKFSREYLERLKKVMGKLCRRLEKRLQ